MVSLAHCHSKRGSSRAETAHVKWSEEREEAGPTGLQGGFYRGGRWFHVYQISDSLFVLFVCCCCCLNLFSVDRISKCQIPDSHPIPVGGGNAA